jgi:hypothetical protein
MRRLGTAVTICVIGSLAFVAPAFASPASDWRDGADEVCTRGNQGISVALIAAFPDGLPSAPTKADIKLVGATATPVFQQQHDEIAALPRPPKLKKQIKKLLSTFQDGVDTIAAAAETGDITIDALDNALVPAAKRAKKLGLKVCGA